MASKRILIITGDGKGKTTSAFGMALRAIGHGRKVSVIQFIKHDGGYGEVAALRRFPEAEVVCSGLGFTPKQPDSPQWEKHRAAALAGWELARQRMADDETSVIILDEFFYPVRYGLIDENEACKAIAALPEGKTLIMTGRNAPESLTALADTVSSIGCIRHALQQGTPAQEGFEY